MIVELRLADEVPDAGEPVSKYREHRHQEGQDDEAVLRVTIEFLEEPGQSQQSSDLEEMYQCSLR